LILEDKIRLFDDIADDKERYDEILLCRPARLEGKISSNSSSILLIAGKVFENLQSGEMSSTVLVVYPCHITLSFTSTGI
jgi:hypothetical protein